MKIIKNNIISRYKKRTIILICIGGFFLTNNSAQALEDNPTCSTDYFEISRNYDPFVEDYWVDILVTDARGIRFQTDSSRSPILKIDKYGGVYFNTKQFEVSSKVLSNDNNGFVNFINDRAFLAVVLLWFMSTFLGFLLGKKYNV